jgi:hypothetical protein
MLAALFSRTDEAIELKRQLPFLAHRVSYCDATPCPELG